jgi:hypothetical protein
LPRVICKRLRVFVRSPSRSLSLNLLQIRIRRSNESMTSSEDGGGALMEPPKTTFWKRSTAQFGFLRIEDSRACRPDHRKVGMVGKVRFEARIRELVENLPDLAVLVEPMLIVRTLREQIVILHRRLLAVVRDDEVCRRLMRTPGVGPWWR